MGSLMHVAKGTGQVWRGLPDVLRGVEDTEGQSGQKIPGRKQPGHRAQGEARSA